MGLAESCFEHFDAIPTASDGFSQDFGLLGCIYLIPNRQLVNGPLGFRMHPPAKPIKSADRHIGIEMNKGMARGRRHLDWDDYHLTEPQNYENGGYYV